MEKKVKWMTQYSKLFVKAMKKIGRRDYKKLENMFRNRYMDHLCSEEFKEYTEHGSVIWEKVYAAITHAQICLEMGITLEEAIRIWEEYIVVDEKKFKCTMYSLLDCLKNGYKLVANYLEKEARKHKADQSMTFEVLKRDDDKLELKINRCIYLEFFEKYDMKELCKVFCNEIHCVEKMEKSSEWIQDAHLFEHECCHIVFSKR